MSTLPVTAHARAILIAIGDAKQPLDRRQLSQVVGIDDHAGDLATRSLRGRYLIHSVRSRGNGGVGSIYRWHLTKRGMNRLARWERQESLTDRAVELLAPALRARVTA